MILYLIIGVFFARAFGDNCRKKGDGLLEILSTSALGFFLWPVFTAGVVVDYLENK